MSSQRRNNELAKAVRAYRVGPSVTDEAIFNFLSAIDSPRSLACWLMYSKNEHAQLVELEVNPDHYESFVKFRDDYQATNFLSKANFLKLPVGKKQAALVKFRQYEELCGKTNLRFRNLSFDPLFKGSNVWLLNAVTRKIDSILGDFCPDEFVDSSNWGPGVTTLLKGSQVSAFNKFQSETGITHRLYSFVEPWFSTAYPLWYERLTSSSESEHVVRQPFTFIEGNEVVTVPKNSKTDRVIAIEPGVNLWFQKGIGSMIRRRLLRVGVDLNSQIKNQQLALSSSRTGEFATVDFSSASDSISYELVREVIPPRWFALLDVCRSPVGTLDGAKIKWNKFSSMGNGFTFELESLIFFAAALAVCDYLEISSKEVSVFGDDVILPSSCYELFREFCDFLGFKVNNQKSFHSGYFRESCGSHYFAGVDCKPIFLKEVLTNAQSLFKLANNVRLLAHRRNSHYGCDASFRRSWQTLFLRVPKAFRFRIPLGFGDGGFVCNFDESTPSKAREQTPTGSPYGACWEGWSFRGVIEAGINQSSEEMGILLARLWSQSPLAYKNTYTLRGRTRVSVSEIRAQQWYNLGPWL
jgi:hypothetical protein